MSRTIPTKLAMPPTRRLPWASRSSSAPTSKSSRCTRIMVLSSRHRREQRHLVAVAQRVVVTDIILVDGDAHRLRLFQRLGVIGAAPAQPEDELGDVAHFRRQRHFLLGNADARP